MYEHALHSLTLIANEKLKPRLHRLTFTADAFATHPLTGPDEYFGLLMPQKGQQFRSISVDGINIRAAVAALPADIRPDLRWYTIRRLDRARKLIDVDIVTHGDTGPGSRWVRAARPGDTAGMFTCPALWTPPASTQLLVADASALPAVRHILSHQLRHNPEQLSQTDVLAVITDHDEIEDGLERKWGDHLRSLTTVTTTKNTETTRAVQALRELFSPRTRPESLWVSGEGDLAKSVRKLAADDWGLPTSDIVWVPYWFHGRARP
ncbi:siderophore-interacting protein [Corynebacterium uterequi]|uniref:Siderophore-interacting protein n=1 Tax=Corynebacterium uterequi TaxID=1072256 RepID=A0A0G3HLL0_9CORY|nr:siderophore-interacting protein [Corynebacterium uterequi]AKK12022.1 siderophore-interacting protein [Corynebacterium uterequi]